MLYQLSYSPKMLMRQKLCFFSSRRAKNVIFCSCCAFPLASKEVYRTDIIIHSRVKIRNTENAMSLLVCNIIQKSGPLVRIFHFVRAHPAAGEASNERRPLSACILWHSLPAQNILFKVFVSSAAKSARTTLSVSSFDHNIKPSFALFVVEHTMPR